MLNIDYSNETITPITSFYDKQSGLLIVNPVSLINYAEIICTDENSRYPQLNLRILIHDLGEIDKENKWAVCPRQISKQLGAHYDTVTKCLKFLRSIQALQNKKQALPFRREFS